MMKQCEGCGRTISTYTEGILMLTERKLSRMSGEEPVVHDEVVKVWCPLCRQRGEVTQRQESA